MRRWLRLVGAVLLGVAVGLIIFRLTDEQPTSQPASFSLRLDPPSPLIDPSITQENQILRFESEAGKWLVGTMSGGVYVTQLPQAGQSVSLPQEPAATLSAGVQDLAVSPTTDRYAAISSSNELVVGTSDAAYTWWPPGPIHVDLVEFSPDGSQLAVAGADVEIIDLSTGDFLGTHERPETQPPQYEDLVISPSGAVIATSTDGVDVWRAGSRTTDGPTRWCNCEGMGSSLSQDGSRAAFGTGDAHLVVLDIQSGDVLLNKTVSLLPQDGISAVSMNADNTLAVAISRQGETLVWDLPGNKAAWRGKLPLEGANRVQFAPGEKGVIIASFQDGFTQTWWSSIVRE
jgi:hypothetical protein